MDSIYPTSQSYTMYEHPSWGGDSKSIYIDDEHDSVLADKSLDSAHVVAASSGSSMRRPSMLKVEDEFTATGTNGDNNPSSQMWSERLHQPHPARSFSQSHVQMMNGTGQPFMRVNDPVFSAAVMHQQQPPAQWSVPHSGASTPTPMYGQVYDMSYAHNSQAFSAFSHDPASAVSMSPQSSQGGWASATSSDGTDQRGMISPTFRPPSPGTVVRPDGIRKKNARFEIPKERNLANIDAMILASTDDNEKKELKQQKRLLRNRQAALDSRQRKKTHTEKLEQEKKVSEKKMFELEEALNRMENTINLEREEFIRQRQHLENVIHALQYDCEEAIRTKTLETAELRRQNNVLKDCVRELERQQTKGYAPASSMHNFNGDFDGFGMEDSWDDEEFDLINNDELKMDDNEQLQRQITPKPSTAVMKSADIKAENGFSWNTFYMCLLFGAFIASNSNNNNNNSHTNNSASSAIASSIPPVEASNVIKTVLSAGGSSTDLVLARSQPVMSDATVNGLSDLHTSHLGPGLEASSSLNNLHQSLASPSRRQEAAAAFSLSASSYQHLTDPFNDHVDVDGHSEFVEPSPQPSALQKAFANMQAQKDNVDRITGMGNKARERSLLWDQVPAEVVKNFEAMVQKTTNVNNNSNNEHNHAERMDQ